MAHNPWASSFSASWRSAHELLIRAAAAAGQADLARATLARWRLIYTDAPLEVTAELARQCGESAPPAAARP